MNDLELAQHALDVRDAMADPDTWCVGFLALAEDRTAPDVLSDKAVQWCAIGHSMRLLNTHWSDTTMALVNAYWDCHGEDLPEDNNSRGRLFTMGRLDDLVAWLKAGRPESMDEGS